MVPIDTCISKLGKQTAEAKTFCYNSQSVDFAASAATLYQHFVQLQVDSS